MPMSDESKPATLTQQTGVLLIHMLNRCNLCCKHCYLDAGPNSESFLAVDTVYRTLKEAGKLGFNTVILSGGEPFMFPDFCDVLRFASRLDDLDLYVSTNGTLIGSGEAEALKRARTNVQVSIDGPEEFHDSFRGCTGAFARARQGIEVLINHEVPLTVVMSVSLDNIEFLSWLAWWALGVGADRVSVQPILHVGRGSQIGAKALSSDQLSDLFLRLSDIGHTYRATGLRFSLAYRSKSFLMAHPCAAYVCKGIGCHRRVEKEIKKIVIREDGTVLPEIPTLDPRFSLGSLSDGSLEELISRYWLNGYSQFHHLCKTVYEENVPTWEAPIIPWDELISERSWTASLKSDGAPISPRPS